MRRGLVLALVLLVSVVGTTAAFADEQTVTVNAKVSSLLFGGKTVLGTLVIKDTGTAQVIASQWTFIGQMDGKPASASGTASGRFTGKSYEGNLTKVDNWDMGGVPAPPAGMPMSVLTGADGTIFGVVNAPNAGTVSVPFAVQGVSKLPEPFKGDLSLSITNLAGASEIKGLPRTGAIPVAFDLLALLLIALGGGVFASSRLLPRRAS